MVNLVSANLSKPKCLDPITFINKDIVGVNFTHFVAITITRNVGVGSETPSYGQWKLV